MNSIIRRTLVASAVAACITLVSAPTAAAQSGPKWQAWIGCWTPSIPGQTVVDLKLAPVICITPTSNPNAIELATLGETKVLGRDTIDASGTEQTITTKNCAGSQTARWSADERRVYLRSASTCDGLKSTTSAILSMSPEGEWLEVRGVSAGGGENVRVARYRAVQIPDSTLNAISGGDRVMASAAARVAAGAPVGTAAITEAVKNADLKVVEAWILERDQAFNLDAKALVELADAGIPGSVTDAMIAITHPEAFQFARASEAGGAIQTRDDVSGRRVYGGVMSNNYCDTYGRYYDPYGCSYSAFGYGRYGYNRYGNGYGYGYGLNGGYYSPAVIIVQSPGSASAVPSGQVVKGRGYTQTSGPANGTASTRDRSSTSTSSSSRGTSSSSGSSSSGSSSSGSSSSTNTSTSSSSGERTAKGRP
jgi:hypothetical protein